MTDSAAAVRRAVPFGLVPLGLIGTALASSLWLRAFPASYLAVPLFGASVLSVLLPVVVIAIGLRTLWVTALIDVVGFVAFTNLAALHSPGAFGSLYHGLVDGPSQILTYALPLVGERTLLVAPVALCWLCGAIVGECIGRGWQSLLPPATLLVTFGLTYGGSARAIADSADAHYYDTIIAAALLLVLLLMRASQSWVDQDGAAETTTAGSSLPIRGLGIGFLVSVLVVVLAVAITRPSGFVSRSHTPVRTPPLHQTNPDTPLAYVAGLRPDGGEGSRLFSVTLSRSTDGYLALADADTYDGNAWSLGNAEFRPTSGTVPVDPDPSSRSGAATLVQRYRIAAGPLTEAPWMPFVDRPRTVSGISVQVDPATGMVVPARGLRAGDQYTVTSTPPQRTFAELPTSVLASTSAAASDLQLGQSSSDLTSVVSAMQNETNTAGAAPIVFLKALAKDLSTKYGLFTTTTSTVSSAPPSPGATRTRSPSPSSGTQAATAGSSQNYGSTGLSIVTTAILRYKTATPEQYATFVALLARKVGVPARVVSGFRVGGGQPLSAGTHTVTTADAWSWVEIPVRGYGWVVLDPTPSRRVASNSQPSVSPRPSFTNTATASTPNLIVSSTANSTGVTPPSRVPGTGSLSALAITGIVVAGLLVVLALLVLARLTQKWVRQRRRRHGDARARVIGAWQESLDVLVESGVPELASLTSAEIVSATRTRYGGRVAAQTRYVAEAANSAIFRPGRVPSADEAAAAWRAQAMLRRSVRRRLSWRQRVAMALRRHDVTRTDYPVGPASWSDAPPQRRTRRAGAGRSH